MKKVYSKPEIMFEDFSVNTNIASGCEVECNSAINECVLEVSYPGIDETLKIFVDEAMGCNTTPSGKYDGLCYHIPDGYNTFNS